MQDAKAKVDRQLAELKGELVCLPLAASITYFHVTDSVRQVDTEPELARVLPIVAMALAAVAPIRAGDGRVLSHTEVKERLYDPLLGPGPTPLEGLAMRRADLKAAMATLKEARIVFGRR